MTLTPVRNDNLDEIAQQPAALQALLDHYNTATGRQQLSAARAVLQRDKPVAIVGMGSSLFAGGVFAAALFPIGSVLRISAEELLNGASLPEGLTFIFISQSGKSGELVGLAQKFPDQFAKSIAITNDPASPLAAACRIALPMCAGTELFSATKTFTNTLALLWLLGKGEPDQDLLAAPGLMQAIIAAHENPLIKDVPNFVVGVGPLASALAPQCGLLFKEVARKHVEGLTLAQFKHGPQEIATTAVKLLFIDPCPTQPTLDYIHRLTNLGAHCTLLTSQPVAGVRTNTNPSVNKITLPGQKIGFVLCATIAAELLVYHAAQSGPTPPGHYIVGAKVTGID